MAINTSHTVSALRNWAIWTLGFFSFPLAGIAGGAISGPVDSRMAAALGGAVTGLVIGTGQWLASGRRLRADRWIPVTTVGRSSKPCVTGNGGRLRGKGCLPSRLFSSEPSSPQI